MSNVQRRQFLAIALALSVTSLARGQGRQAPAVIGWLHMSTPVLNGRELAEFREGMAALGWKEGAHYVVEERWADGKIERLQALAEDLAKRKPMVVVSWPTQPIRASLKAMPAVPVVQVAAADPVVTGFAASMSHPGGMVTGLSNIVTDTAEKLLELLVAAVPKLQRVGFFADSTNFAHAKLVGSARNAAARLGVAASIAEVGKSEDIEPAMARLLTEKVQALVVMASPLFVFERRRIMKYAQQYRWPVAAQRLDYGDEGALICYGINVLAQFRRAAYYVDKILKGAKPGDLPIEQPMTLEMVVNQKAARTLGLKIPQSILLRADRLIE